MQRSSAERAGRVPERGWRRTVHRWMVLTVCLGVLGACPPVAAEESTAATPAKDKAWSIEIEPYLWISGLEGTVGTDRLQAATSITFVDILENFEGAAMGALVVRYERLGLFVDGNYVDLGRTVPLPGAGLTGITGVGVDLTLGFGTAAAFFTFRPTPGLKLEPYVGARWWHLGAGLQILPVGPRFEPSRAWADPVFGLGIGYDITDRWFVESMLDVGGGVSKFTWQLYASTGYRFRDWLALTAGWRYVGVDYARDGLTFDATVDGLLIGLKFTL